MEEQNVYWRQLFKALIEEISSPLSEIIWGGVATFVFLWHAFQDYGLTTRMIFAILFAPSFLILMHGMHRGLPTEEAEA